MILMSCLLLPVLEGRVVLVGHILVERSAARDIEDLDAPADAEGRDVPLNGLFDQLELESIAKWILHVTREAPYWVRYEGPNPKGGATQVYERG